MSKTQKKNRKCDEEKLYLYKVIAESFPAVGNVRAHQCAAYLGIGLSTFWLYVAQQRIQKPLKYGERISVWDAKYIHELRTNGIPQAPESKPKQTPLPSNSEEQNNLDESTV